MVGAKRLGAWAIGVLLLGCTASALSQESGELDALVRQLGDLPSSIQAFDSHGIEHPTEILRREIYDRLLTLAPASVAHLTRALRSPDTEVRRNVALALGALSGGWWRFGVPPRHVELDPVLPALIDALADTDPTVRARTAQAIGNVGAGGATAVPALIGLLAKDDEASRNSACIALRGIGSPASAALPSLHSALSDPSADVRRFAGLAITRIERDGQ